jgi:quinol monooxygenase YgiN
VDAHGNYDIKVGNLADTATAASGLLCASRSEGAVSELGAIRNLESIMIKNALFVRLEAKPGQEKELAQFLQAGLDMAMQESTTPVWFALRLGPSTFGIFDAFADEAGRQAHLNGPIAEALGANAPRLLAQAPSIERIDVLGAKLPG